jgi:nucleoside-diphosphate kinase
MTIERTLSIIKPDAVGKNLIGSIISRFEAAGLRVAAAKMVYLRLAETEQFYAIHKGKPFFEALTRFMSSGPALALVLEGEGAIQKNRDIMGATNPKKALPGTIRGDFCKDVGENIERNAVHGSDAVETAKAEIAFFFGEYEIFSAS